MPFDYKKEFKEFYLPPAKPQIVHIPVDDPPKIAGRYTSKIAHCPSSKMFSTMAVISAVANSVVNISRIASIPITGSFVT